MRNVPRMSEENRELVTAATRDRAFECGCGLLREEGWRGFTMEKLASRMGVAKGTLYNYFRDKDSVALFICGRVASRAASAAEEEMERSADTAALLRSCVAAMLRCMGEYHFLSAALCEIVHARLGAKSAAVLPDEGDAPRRALTKLIERGMMEGVFRRGDPGLTAALIQSAVAGVYMARCFDGYPDAESEDVRETLCGMILRGICAERTEETR